MEIIKTFFDKVFLIKTLTYKDNRGCFFESYNYEKFNSLIREKINFVQDNCSVSKRAVLRGMHYQIIKPQGKLIRVLKGSIYDVVVDLRKNSPTFGQWEGIEISANNNFSLWIPKGFAHGFMSLEDDSTLFYKVSDFWYKEYDRSLIWNDSDVAIKWPKLDIPPIISDKDFAGVQLSKLDVLL